MTHKIFIDSGVLLDVLAKRLPFYNDSAALLSLAENNLIRACTTPIVFANIFNILRKLKTKLFALDSLRKLRIIISIFSITENDVEKHLHLNSKILKTQFNILHQWKMKFSLS